MIIIHLQKLRKKKQWHVVGFEPRLPCDSLYHQSLGKDTHELVFVDITSLVLIGSDLLVWWVSGEKVQYQLQAEDNEQVMASSIKMASVCVLWLR